MSRPLPCHVWVDTAMRWGIHARPGLLLAWRRTETGWRAQVAFALEPNWQHPEEWTLYQQWVDADHVRPAEAEPPPQDLSGYRPVGEPPGS